jgi:integrase
MGSVEKRVRDGRQTWLTRWRDPAGMQHKRTFGRKIDAERALISVESSKLRGSYIDPAAGKITLRTYVEDRWLPALIHVRPTTDELYRAHLRNHLLPALGSHPVSSLTRTDCRTLVAALSARLAPSTVGTVVAVLRAVLAAAVDDGLIPANPCRRVALPRVEQRVVEPLPPAAVLALAEAVPARYAVTVWLAAGAGLRQGEALGLTIPRVDFLRRRVHVEEQIQGANGGVPVLCALKTRASRRVVPLDDVVLGALASHRARWAPGPGGLLVTNSRGQPVRRSSFGMCWREAVKVAGLPPGTRFHDLRHFFASSLIAAGLHPKEIQVRMGHATIGETMDTYGHLFPNAEDSGRGAIDAMLRPATVPRACPTAR